MSKPPDVLRIAIIGCGKAAQQHVEALAIAGRSNGFAARIVAVVDQNETRASEFAKKNGAEVLTGAQVFGDKQIDCVSICTPPDGHAELAIAALRTGKSVLIEKPVARTIEELNAIVAAAEAVGRPALAMLQHRGRIPAAALTNVWTNNSCATIEVTRDRPSGHYLSEPWRHDPNRSGGGHVAHLAVHYIDLACQLLGTPSSVVGLTDCRDAAHIDSRAALAIRFANGALMTVLTSAHPAPRAERLYVVDGDRALLITDAKTEYRDGSVEYPAHLRTPNLRALVYKDWWEAIRGEAVSDRYSIARTRGVTAVLEAVRTIAATENGV